MTEIYRGDIYYIMPFYTVTGSEQRAGRPGVVVSNDINNRHSPNVEIVFLTSQEKKPLPHSCSRDVPRSVHCPL